MAVCACLNVFSYLVGSCIRRGKFTNGCVQAGKHQVVPAQEACVNGSTSDNVKDRAVIAALSSAIKRGGNFSAPSPPVGRRSTGQAGRASAGSLATCLQRTVGLGVWALPAISRRAVDLMVLS